MKNPKQVKSDNKPRTKKKSVKTATSAATSKVSKPKQRAVPKAFNGLSPQEWTRLSRNVWSDVSSPRGPRQLAHGAVFPLKLAERMVSLYSGEGDLVVDPFLGIGTTAVAAKRLGRNSLGTELNPRFAEEAENWLAEDSSLFRQTDHKVIVDDCRNISNYLSEESVQFSFTSPPYANFIQRSVKDRQKTHKTSRIVHSNNSRVKQYSESPQDFGNLDYDKFLNDLRDVFVSLLRVTKVGGYSAWVVKDYRLPPNRPYISMHSDLAAVACSVGWLWQDLIVWDQNEQRRLILLGYPSRFYSNQNCSFIVVFRRGE